VHWAAVEETRAIAQTGAPWELGSTAGAASVPLGELVWEPLPCGSTVAGICPESRSVWCVSASAVAPHRCMVPLCYPEHNTRCQAGIGILFSSTARRVKEASAAEVVCGIFPVLLFADRSEPGETGRLHESYNISGPLMAQGLPSHPLQVELVHNGVSTGAAQLFGADEIAGLVAAATDSVIFSAGDALVIPLVESAKTVQPGDHAQAGWAGIRPVAINVGMRGSA